MNNRDNDKNCERVRYEKYRNKYEKNTTLNNFIVDCEVVELKYEVERDKEVFRYFFKIQEQ